MKERDIKKILRQMGEHPRYQAMTDKEVEASRRKLLIAIGGNPDAQRKQYGYRDYGLYFFWQFKKNALRPLAIGFAAFAVLIGGWGGMVNASFDTVPGDVLYPVKIATERAQLTMALTDERKAKLHVEFASRRLDEVAIITSSGEPSEEQVRVAMEGFTREIESVSQTIEEMKAEDLESATELAKIVDRKVDEYTATIKQTEPEIPEENLPEITVAYETVDSADDQATEVMVENHEAAQEERTAADLEKTFQKDLADIREQYVLSTGRLSSIEAALLQYDLEGEEDYLETIDELYADLAEVKPLENEAMDFLAVGGYRRAFEIVETAFDMLDSVETEIVRLEISISTEVAALVAEEEEPGAVETGDAPIEVQIEVFEEATEIDSQEGSEDMQESE